MGKCCVEGMEGEGKEVKRRTCVSLYSKNWARITQALVSL